MPEKDEEKTLEAKSEETEETQEDSKKETQEKTKESEEEVKTKPSEEEKQPEDEEPKKRFPQTPVDKQLGYRLRKLEEENRRLKEEGSFGDDDEEEKPITRRELNELLERQYRETASESMVNRFIIENPEFKKYEGRIRKYVNDPDYSNVPIGFIASGIVGETIDDEANLRAELKRKADEEAAKTKTGGSTKRAVPGTKKGVWDMSKEEFEEYQNQVLQQSREE